MSNSNQEDFVYHILSKADLAQAQSQGIYTPESLDSAGFIHCSTLEQVQGSAQGFFKGQDGLLLLKIEASKVHPEMRYEDLMGEGMRFPHLYGPLNLDAVVGAAPLQKDAAGEFLRPEESQFQPLEDLSDA